MNRGHLRHSLLVELAVVGSLASVPALGAGGRRFKSFRPDHLKQWVMVEAVAHFLFGVASGVANEGQIGLNSFLPINMELFF